QQVVAAYRARDAQLSALVRALAYRRRGAAGMGMPLSGIASGAGGLGGGVPPGGGLVLPALSGLSALAGARRHPPSTLSRATDSRGERVPGGPGEAAVKAALSRLGRPYVWGAKGPNAFDCSGLTWWAWRQAGVQLGADTYRQFDDGIPVPAGQVRAGDLIFPKDSFGEGGTPGPGHVQLAISPTEVIHAPTPGDVVRIARMPSSYVARRPVPVM
uniref:C40 family peptidase n=1 Tax=uncultured Mycobacterium sp. TaxID=171292 RepID=UPI0035CC6744